MVQDNYENSLATISAQDVMDSLNYVDDTCVSPYSWERVFKKYPNLRFNFAHYGGMQSWIGTDEAAEALGGKHYFDWKKKISALAKQYTNVYTDIACYYNYNERLRDYRMLCVSHYNKVKSGLEAAVKDKKITEKESKLVLGYYKQQKGDANLCSNCYKNNEFDGSEARRKDLYYLDNSLSMSQKEEATDILQKAKIICFDILKIAEGIAEMVKDEAVRKKVMMGSDWPMYETSFGSTAEYYTRMFELCGMISMILDKKHGIKCDIWHQFAVLNPAAFLGLLNKDGKSLNKKKLEAHKKAIPKWIEVDTKEKQEFVYITAGLTDDELSDTMNLAEDNLNELLKVNKTPLKPANEMFDPNDKETDKSKKTLLILQENYLDEV